MTSLDTYIWAHYLTLSDTLKLMTYEYNQLTSHNSGNITYNINDIETWALPAGDLMAGAWGWGGHGDADVPDGDPLAAVVRRLESSHHLQINMWRTQSISTIIRKTGGVGTSGWQVKMLPHSIWLLPPSDFVSKFANNVRARVVQILTIFQWPHHIYKDRIKLCKMWVFR